MHAFPAVLPLRVGEEAIQYLGVEIALAFEIRIEAAVRESRACHDLCDRNGFKAVAIEQPSCAVDDLFLCFSAMSSGIWHPSPPVAATI